jgi:hypothetical protein
VINTCPGQTEGCGGGKDAKGIVDTKQGHMLRAQR